MPRCMHEHAASLRLVMSSLRSKKRTTPQSTCGLLLRRLLMGGSRGADGCALLMGLSRCISGGAMRYVDSGVAIVALVALCSAWVLGGFA